MTRRLIIDLQRCDACGECTVDCGGVPGLRERATFSLLCRRCRQASCLLACPFQALERSDDGTVIRRHNLRCVACTLCAQACPFGTIYTELLPFYVTACEPCLDEDRAPACVAACPHGALAYRGMNTGEGDTGEADVHVVDEHLAARARKWVKNESGEARDGEGVR
jgi:Fe-S-cluster-containing dehydrogenase component